MFIRYAQLNDKTEWFRLDRHLPEEGFEEKIRNKQGYVLTENGMGASRLCRISPPK
ncbi:hypothetical protein SAMN05660484_02326 [Eubacterium ruminantium]|uniref:Uncharacterized protein n=1 Tax=Eubacterium ruminantium TaxID=42322 RepID=A0A1T4LEG6_9FIRM|nr:hypothetical protein [Eubacterium ruminantium]SCW65613.1 hypothetical protein SAMN05660484_02326 [Eubacterium ruminantium]SDN25987.1 hypothetical protein SAMN04490370_1158 [Eubacterium ruminantium]SJZ52948.1 hypothetical protein SAMN02745110_00812 [Eubacterium ruminantium]